MRAIVLAELRGAWSSWLAVFLAFVATSFGVLVSALAVSAVNQLAAGGELTEMLILGMQITAGWNLGFALLGGLNVISAVTALVVQARRGALARLALAGATPGQVSRILIAQLAVVSAGAAVFGAAAAAMIVRPALRAEMRGQQVAADIAHELVSGVTIDLDALLLGSVAFVGWALISGLGPSRVAAHIPPIEALRTVPGATVRRRRIGAWVGSVLLALIVGGLTALGIALAPHMGVDAAATAMQLSVLAILIGGGALALSAPLTVGLLTRAWTSLIPSRSAPWMLARAGVIAKGERLARTVTPTMFTVGILVGMGAIVASIQGYLASIGRPPLGQSDAVAVFLMIGVVLLISTAGGVSVVLMMSRQREAELALVGVTGATRDQQVLIVVLEGLIITVTATLLGCILSGVGLGVYTSIMGAAGKAGPPVIPWDVLGAVALVFAAINVAATTLPVLPSLGRPARSVVAQLVAE